MLKKQKIARFTATGILIILTLNILSLCPGSPLIVDSAAAATPSSDWYYSDWQYRKPHDISTGQTHITNFYSLSSAWTVISGNPSQRHTFQPVHDSALIEVNKPVDGNTWKYLAYDSDPEGSQIRLYYTNDTAGTWTSYSQNPILGPRAYYYRWPSTTYVNGVFNMFVEDRSGGALERWSSTDGIHYTFMENVRTGGNEYQNPFIFYSTNDNRWYLYSHDASGTLESLKVRSASSLDGLRTASDSIVLSRNLPFGAATVMYYNGYYWLLAEIFENNLWKVVAYYSTSPSSGFTEVSNSPILSADQACPTLYLSPSKTRAFLFTTEGASVWYQRAREVNLSSPISGQLTDLSNYQIKINVNYGSGTSQGDTVYLGGHGRTNFADLRFTWYNASQHAEVECPYWIEQYTTGANAVIWVKVPQIQSSNSTLYVYYGQSSAATTSNGAQTFEFFDDFSGSLSKWTTVGGTWQIQSGELVGQTSAFGQRLRANNFVFANNTVHVNIKWASGTYFEGGPYIRGQSPNEQNSGYITLLSAWAYDSRDRISLMSGGSETTLAAQGTTNPSKNVWYTYVFKAAGNSLSSTISPLYPSALSATSNAFSSGSFCLFSWSATSETINYDNVFITKASLTEPTQGSWYAEEAAQTSATVEVDASSVSDARADVGSTQTIAFHAKWSNGSAITAGSIYVNATQLAINSTGWASLSANNPAVTAASWTVTGVNVNGVTAYSVTAATPRVIWDQIAIVEGNLSATSLYIGENATVWFKAAYQYDNKPFNGSTGSLMVNGTTMLYSSANSRWETTVTASQPGAAVFQVSGVYDSQFGLTKIADAVGSLGLSALNLPLTIVSNSTVTDFAFNSTAGTVGFTVSGPSGTSGFVNLTLAKSLVEDVTNLKIYIDSNQTSFNVTGNGFYWMISFAYNHSTHSVLVVLDSTLLTQETSQPTPAATATPASQSVTTSEIAQTTSPQQEPAQAAPTQAPTLTPSSPQPSTSTDKENQPCPPQSLWGFSVLQLAVVALTLFLVSTLVALRYRGLRKQTRIVLP
ncbi:MAG: DUF2341 domain-containing protein [Candidatus Bathyarchaeota archaeon]|nr:DUF2341 domain-containing protein [Candidatus Bathyarchaeota archaeon]